MQDNIFWTFPLICILSRTKDYQIFSVGEALWSVKEFI